MSIGSRIAGLVRRATALDYADGSFDAVINNRGDLSTALGLPPKTELVRLANSWNCQIATGSAFTNVAAMPTTRAELAFYNGYGDNTCMVIDQIWFLSLTSITALSNATIVWQVGSPAALTNDTAQLINSPSGKVYSGSVTRAVAVTTMTANKWAALATGTNAATASIGFGVVGEARGGIVVKPGFTLGVNAVVGTATGTSLLGVSWHEVKLPLA